MLPQSLVVLTQHHELVTTILRSSVVKAIKASELEFGSLHITDQADQLPDDGLGAGDGSDVDSCACLPGIKKRLRLFVRLPSSSSSSEGRASVQRLVKLALCIADIVSGIKLSPQARKQSRSLRQAAIIEAEKKNKKDAEVRCCLTSIPCCPISIFPSTL